jgi:hypothetical protein
MRIDDSFFHLLQKPHIYYQVEKKSVKILLAWIKYFFIAKFVYV